MRIRPRRKQPQTLRWAPLRFLALFYTHLSAHLPIVKKDHRLRFQTGKVASVVQP